MPEPGQVLQPQYFSQFRCIGAGCEDTCCNGWDIPVDRTTFEKYRGVADPEIRERLSHLVVLNASSQSPDNHAKIKLNRTVCPGLSDGLCSIQQQLGEEYLSSLCVTFPRIRNVIGGVLERSLDVSCPEAARFILLNSSPLIFLQTSEIATDRSRPATMSILNADHSEAYPHLNSCRNALVALLQNRSHSLAQRLMRLADAVEELAGPSGSWSQAPVRSAAQKKLQLEVVLELIVARIKSEYTAPRFLECYRNFMDGLGWTAELSLDELTRRYSNVMSQFYLPFIGRHEYLLENYLVNYVFATMFPFGSKTSGGRLALDFTPGSMRTQTILLTVYYSMIRTVLAGMAGLYREALGADHVVKLVQSFTKAFQHSTSYPKVVVQILGAKKLDNREGIAILLSD